MSPGILDRFKKKQKCPATLPGGWGRNKGIREKEVAIRSQDRFTYLRRAFYRKKQLCLKTVSLGHKGE